MAENTTTQVAQASGLSFRQLDYYIRQGAITLQSPGGGSGVHRHSSETEMTAAIALGIVLSDLSAIGLQPTVPFIGRLWEKLSGGPMVLTLGSVSIRLPKRSAA